MNNRLMQVRRHLAAWAIIIVGLAGASALASQAAAEPAAPSTAVALLTVTPSPTPVLEGAVCTPTLTASPSIIGAGQTTTVTFDDGCACPDAPAGTVCDYFPWALSSIDAPGFTGPSTPILPPVPYEIELTATDIGMRTITLTYDGETEYVPPGIYIRTPLTASTEVLVVEPTPTPPPPPTLVPGTVTPTPPTPTPVGQVSILCHEFLSVSDSSPQVGDVIDVTFHSNCRCEPMDIPGTTCSFSQYEVNAIIAPGFDTPETPIGPPGPSTVQLTATEAGSTMITMRYYGEDYVDPPGVFNFTYRTASLAVTVEPADAPADTAITLAESCLAGNGRADFNIVNEGSAAATYRIEFSTLTPRALSVEAGDWWRMPVTGRSDGGHPVTITRDGVVVHEGTVDFSCDDAVPAVSAPEVSIVNACRGGLGYLLFQFVNPTAVPRGYVIAFENVPNRSTTAQAFGQSVRAVTGRGEGPHSYVVRGDGEVIGGGVVDVDCA